METFRSIQLDMLCEIDRLCRENNIPYILSRYTAYSAVLHHTLPRKVLSPTIAMTYADAIRLSELVSKEERGIESALTNRRMSRMVLRYSRTDTTCLRVDEWNQLRYPGIGIEIELIHPVPSKSAVNKVWKLLEAETSISSKFRCLSAGWRILFALPTLLEKPALRIAYTGRAFNHSHRGRIARFPQKSIEFPSSMLLDRQEIDVMGKSLFVSRNIDSYLELEFGETYMQKDPEWGLDELYLTTIDPEMPCAEAIALVRELYGKGPNVNWIHHFILRGRMRALRRKIKKYWDLLYCTQDRFALWKQLMPNKATICRQFQQGELDEVHVALQPYLTALERNLTRGFALCFDKELFDIALSLLEADGKTTTAQQLRALVLPEHLVALKIEGFDYD